MVVDTSAWIEWLIGSATGAEIEERLPDRSEWVVPTMVQLELCKWLTREVGDDKADAALAFSQTCVVSPLDTRIALMAADICRVNKLPTADAIVYASAIQHGAALLTCDSHFEGLPNVTYVAKVPP